jgi:hypothetical protein
MPLIANEVHHRESKIVEHINGCDRRIELDCIEQDGLMRDQYDVRQMQVAVATPHMPLPAALFQQPANPKKRGLRCPGKITDVGFRKAGRGPKRSGIALNEPWDRFDPGVSWRQRREGVGGCDRIGNGLNETLIRFAGCCQMIDGLSFVEARHFNRKFDRYTVSIDTQRSIAT